MLIYKLSSGAEEADFYIYTLKKWKAAHKRRKRSKKASALKDVKSSLSDNISLDSSSVASSVSNLSDSCAVSSTDTISTMYKAPQKAERAHSQVEYFKYDTAL